MEENSLAREKEYLQKNKKKKRWRKIVSTLACIVVFCTTYALILPAITMANDKVLACPIDVHEHDDACYNDEGSLICGKADFVVHIHNDDCYDADGKLVCTLPEIRAHKHTPDCYEEVKTLTCTLEEGETHTHSDECYQVESVLICDNIAILHKHKEACYDENGDLICGQLEVLQHIHDECCFADAEDETEVNHDKESAQTDKNAALNTAEAFLVPTENTNNAAKKAAPKKAPAKAPAATNQFDLAQYITTVNIQRREPGSTYWENIIDNNVKVNDELRFDISYEIPAGTLSAGNDTVVYHVPGNLVVTKADSGNVVDASGATVGTYNIGTDGNITIVFNNDYVNKNANGSKINGHIAFESSVDAMGGEDGEDILIPFKESVTLHVKPANGDLSVEKTSKNIAPIDGTLDYEIVVSSVEGTSGPVVVEDIMTNVSRTSAYTVVDQNGNPVSYVDLGGEKIKLPALNPNSSYKITYSAKTAEIPESYNKYIEATNTVNVTSTDSIGQTVEGTDSVTDKFTKYLINKTGTLENGQISWKIRVNPNQADNQVDLSGWTVSDELNGQPFTGTVTITPDPNTGTGSLQTTLPYTFPEGTPIRGYDITYSTAGDSNTKNVGILTPPNGRGIPTGEIGPGSYSAYKKAGGDYVNGVYIIGEDADGNATVKLDWSLTVDTTNGAVPTHLTKEILGRTSAQWPNHAFWCLYDSATNSYMTAAQAQEMAANAAAAIEGSGYTGGYYIFIQNGSSWTQAGYNPILIAKGGSTADDFWSAYEKPVPADSTWKVFYIYFDSEFEAGHVMNINYSTTGVVEEIYQEKKFGNTFFVKSTKDAGNTFSSIYYPVIEKRDARNAYVEGATTYDENNIPGVWINGKTRTDILRWRVNLFLPANIDYTEDVIITEKIPEGLSLDLQDAKNNQYGIYVTFGNNEGGSYNGYRNMYDSQYARFANPGGTLNYSVNSLSASPYGSVSTQGTAVYNANSYTANINGLSTTINKISDNEYQIVIPAATANALKGYIGAVWIDARLTDNWDGISHAFTNNATITIGGDDKLGEASQTQIVKRSVLTKTSEGIREDGTIPYALDINPAGANLVMNSDTLTLTDTLSYTQPAGGTVNAMLDYDSVRVYAVDENENLTDITSQCPYTVSEGTDSSGKIIHTIRMTVPDNVHVKVMYSYKMSGNGYLTDLANTATVEGQGGDSDNDKHVMEVAVQQSNAGAVVVGVNVYKVDSENYAVHLNGAEFKLEKWNGNAWVQTNTYVTNEEKGFFNTGALDANTAYRLTETKAPQGYEMRTATVYEFYILDTSAGAPAICMPDNFEGRALNNGDDITIANYSIDYELPETGGTGTPVFYALGSAMILGAVLLFARKKRIDAEN